MRSKNNNKSGILDIVKNYGPITIKDIAKLSGLSIPSVTAVVDLFLADKLFLEQTSTELVAGRRPKVIYINPEYAFVVGIDLGMANFAYIGFFNLVGEMICKERIHINACEEGMSILNIIIEGVKRIIGEFGSQHGELCAIVIGNPGIVNPQTGSLTLAAHNVRWADLPINHIFEQVFGVEVITLNDVNLSAIGEKEFGASRGYQNSVFVRVGIGLKAGVIFNGSLYQGDTYSAGEIGNNVIICPNLTQKEMQITTAEDLLSMGAIFKKIASDLPNHTDDIFYSLVGGDPDSVTIENVLRVLVSEKSYVNDIIREAGYLLGYVLSNLVSTLDIALIIIGGDIVKFHNYVFKPIRESVSAVLPSPPTIITSLLAEDVALWGAASVGLEYAMQKITKDGHILNTGLHSKST